jgi:hypothetical protein
MPLVLPKLVKRVGDLKPVSSSKEVQMKRIFRARLEIQSIEKRALKGRRLQRS